jgi:hypothetical protein
MLTSFAHGGGGGGWSGRCRRWAPYRIKADSARELYRPIRGLWRLRSHGPRRSSLVKRIGYANSYAFVSGLAVVIGGAYFLSEITLASRVGVGVMMQLP